MKKRYIYIALLMASLSASAQSIRKVYGGQIDVTQHLFAQKGDSLIIKMDINLNALDVPSSRELELTPALKADSLGKLLPTILVRGNHKQREARRLSSLLGKKGEEMPSPYYETISMKEVNSTVSYRVAVPFEEWMQNAQLIFIEDLCGCAGAKQQVGVELLAEHVLMEKRFEVSPQVAYITPEAETVKARTEQSKAYLDFQVGKSSILSDFRNNPRELAKIRKMIDAVKNDKYISITGITVTGNASPDGLQASNERLSVDRARALIGYLSSQYDFSKDKYHYEGLGEDWKMLRSLVDSSFTADKDAVLAVIDNNESLDSKELKLKKLSNGRTYKEIKERFYPLLRRSDCKVYYTVQSFSPQEGREIIKANPRLLSLNEMFLVANTYEKGSEQFNEVFDIAAHMYPDSKVANLNATAAAIERNEMASARKYIRKAGEMPEGYNNLGVMELLEGNWEAAERLFTKAKDAGNKESVYNLEQLKLKLENNKLFEFVDKQSN